VQTALLSLHGFTMNGAGLRHMMESIEPSLSDVLHFAYPDAPHTASEASVAGLSSLVGGFRAKPPNLEWWNASDDGLTYPGWETTRDALRAMAERLEGAGHPVALLGFSQGAAVAAALAALSERGGFPKLRFVVLVAGFSPRARDIAALFEEPVRVPSLHVWGELDRFAKHGPKLLERFDPDTREVLTWPGRHIVPTSGSAADTLVSFLRRHA
jgi:predicted esterase